MEILHVLLPWRDEILKSVIHFSCFYHTGYPIMSRTSRDFEIFHAMVCVCLNEIDLLRVQSTFNHEIPTCPVQKMVKI